MKALAVFFSFYIVMLSVIPCPDVAQHDHAVSTALSQSPASDQHGDSDHCSPFCTCQCCQANFDVSVAPYCFTPQEFRFIYHENNPDFKSPDLFEFLIPPKA